MVLSYGLFERRFGNNPEVIGKTVSVNGYPLTITGVLPKAFRFLFPQQWVSGDERREIDAYIPIPAAVMRLPEWGEDYWQTVIQRLGPAPFAVCVIGRLKPNIFFEQPMLRQRLFTPASSRNTQVLIEPASCVLAAPGETRWRYASRVDDPTRCCGFRFGDRLRQCCEPAAGACHHTAKRDRDSRGGRRRSSARRPPAPCGGLSSGATRRCGRTRSARWGLSLMVRLGSEAVPRLGETRIDTSVLLFTLAVSLITGILFGSGPGISLWRPNLHEMLNHDTRASSAPGGRLRIRRFLVTAEVALAIVLLTGAGLM